MGYEEIHLEILLFLKKYGGGVFKENLSRKHRDAKEENKTQPIKNWGEALNQLVIEFGKERVPF